MRCEGGGANNLMRDERFRFPGLPMSTRPPPCDPPPSHTRVRDTFRRLPILYTQSRSRTEIGLSENP